MTNLVLIVTYNVPLMESATIKSLIDSIDEIKDYSIFIWDNSENESKHEELKNIFESNGVNLIYEHHPENMPLSRLYNNIIFRYKDKFDYLFLLDHDSSFDGGFFSEVRDKKEKGINLFLPIIKYKDTIVSPTKKFFLKGFYFKRKPYGIQRASNISAINSGMVISFDFLKKSFIGYDERLKFYGTDDYFMMEYCKYENELFILNYEFEHDLTLSTLNPSSDQLVNSYKQMLDAWDLIYSKSSLRYLVKLYRVIHSTYTAIKYKNKNFLIWEK